MNSGKSTSAIYRLVHIILLKLSISYAFEQYSKNLHSYVQSCPIMP